jgi:hypothetical protein
MHPPIALIPESRIDRELDKLLQVPVPYNLRRYFPYAELGSQRFVLLLYTLFRRGLDAGWYKGEFDALGMTASTAHLGRMLLLGQQGKWKGLVSVRQMPGALSEPDLAREIIAVVLTWISGRLPVAEAGPIRLFLALSGRLQPAAEQMAARFPQSLLAQEKLRDWALEVMESQDMGPFNQPADTLEELERRLLRCELELVLPAHMDQRLAEHPDIKSLFFGVEMVSSEQMLRTILGRGEWSEMPPDQRSDLARRVESADPERAFSLGLFRFLGYPREFIQHLLSESRLRETLLKGAELRAELGYAVLDFLHEKTVLVTQVLLSDAPGKASDPARQAVLPYVFSRIIIKYIITINSQVLLELARSGAQRHFYEQADLHLIKSDLLQQASWLASGELPLPVHGEARETRRMELLREAALECPDPQELSRRFDRDWEALQPVVRAAEKKMISLLPRDPLLVLEGFSALGSSGRLENMLQRLRSRFGGGGLGQQ